MASMKHVTEQLERTANQKTAAEEAREEQMRRMTTRSMKDVTEQLERSANQKVSLFVLACVSAP